MKIDLSHVELFNSDKLELDKPINFIFGKNGSGKSTISRLIKEQVTDKDVRIYQGIKSVIADGKLNAVILGEDNVIAQRNIDKFEEEISKFEAEKKDYEIEEQQNSKRKDIKDREVASQESKIKKFYRDKAREIKNYEPRISSTSYNQPSFEEELRYAFHLSEDEKERCKEYLAIEEKVAKKIVLQECDFKEMLDSVNNILSERVEEERGIIRLDSDSKKTFARKGLDIHKPGDSCAFCGNVVSNEVFSELESFFSVSKIKEFELQIIKKITEIEEINSEITVKRIKKDEFYSQFHQTILDYEGKWLEITKNQTEFLDILKERLQEKLSQLFSSSKHIQLELPKSLDEIIAEYNNIVELNNLEDISRLKKFSRDLLRFDLIDMYIKQFDFSSEQKKLLELKEDLSTIEIEYKNNKNQIEEIEKSISEVRAKILDEIQKTRSEKKLATNINKKLDLYVSFQLEHVEVATGSQKGYYRIKNKDTKVDEYREISTLSEGEKNIIGFLYFIEKLKEQTESQIDKVIIFDDPIDSNDDLMQYIIVTEIQELMRLIDKKKTNNILVIMTHNSHFYINVKYNRLYEDGKDRNGADKTGDRFIRIQKENSLSTIKILTSEGQDFTTSYELLWKELRFLYDQDKPSLMLNSIRRIIETFTKFNRTDNFYNENKEAQKLFNVNSHSIDDLQAELNGKNREQIVGLMRQCFEENGATSHFRSHWRSSNK